MRLNMDMLTAIEKVDESILGTAPATGPDGQRVPTAADNDRALAELSMMMGALK